jgi:hypothetical protein
MDRLPNTIQFTILDYLRSNKLFLFSITNKNNQNIVHLHIYKKITNPFDYLVFQQNSKLYNLNSPKRCNTCGVYASYTKCLKICLLCQSAQTCERCIKTCIKCGIKTCYKCYVCCNICSFVFCTDCSLHKC